MTRDELVDHFYEKFDYKKWYRFNISFRRHAGDALEKMTDRKLNAFSEGQRSRAILEPLLIVLELEEKKMSNPLAPKITLIDHKVDGKNHFISVEQSIVRKNR